MGLRNSYVVTGMKNVQTLFGSPDVLDGNFLQLTLMDRHWGMSKGEIRKFANDKSGRLQAPAPGTEDTPEDQRYWLGHSRLYSNYLTNRKYSDGLADSFYRLFSERLDRQSSTEWTTIRLIELIRTEMAESAVISLFGSRIIDLNPGFIENYWAFDEVAGTIVFGPPRWLRRRPFEIRERFRRMNKRYIDSAWEKFDWNGPDVDSMWDPHFGSRLARESAKWLREAGFSNDAAAGHTLASLFG